MLTRRTVPVVQPGEDCEVRIVPESATGKGVEDVSGSCLDSTLVAERSAREALPDAQLPTVVTRYCLVAVDDEVPVEPVGRLR